MNVFQSLVTDKFRISLSFIIPVILLNSTMAQNNNTIVFDTFHGQNARNGEVFSGLLPKESATIEVNTAEISDTLLRDKRALILFSPSKPFHLAEKEAITKYLHSGGAMLLIFDEERRMSLSTVGVNDLIVPFGLELTTDAPVPHNCGAIAEKSEVCKEKRELPYSGGRSIKGGVVISKVYNEGDYVHSAYQALPQGGKIIVMSDGMAGLLLGRPDGERFSGTGPSDSRYWGKDSRIFMEEILAFLLK